jgi:hypothetical protein
MIVPTIKVRAPYSSFPGVAFHSGEKMKLKKPNSLNAGMEHSSMSKPFHH